MNRKIKILLLIIGVFFFIIFSLIASFIVINISRSLLTIENEFMSYIYNPNQLSYRCEKSKNIKDPN